jgi:CheY-like chemotaxis protein
MHDLSNIIVLVIDDSYVNRQLMKSILDTKIKEITEAGDGIEALEILESGILPDMIILDLMMPVMDGVETLKKIRELGYSMPIIVITADIDGSKRTKCLELGISGYINKPIHGSQVVKLIREVLNKTDIISEEC